MGAPASGDADTRRGRPSTGISTRTVTTVGLVVLGLGCCVVLAVRIHIVASSLSAGHSHLPTAFHLRTKREHALRRGARAQEEEEEEMLLSDGKPDQHVRKVPLARRLVDTGLYEGPRFALVPRPVRFEVLLRDGVLDKAAAPALTLTLWWFSSSLPQAETQESWAVHAYEQALGKKAALAGSLDKIPDGGLALAIAKNRQECLLAALRSVRKKLDTESIELTSEFQIPGAVEWHLALQWQGRLAVCATTAEGLFRFASTLKQILWNGGQKAEISELPPFLLEDWPTYTWRGLHLDTVRHFMPMSFLKRYLTAMSLYKANVFQWHLTDDQSWRLEIPSRPRLVEASAQVNPGFYSEKDVKELLDFAARLFITVVPVIETPGHSIAALVAYPELSCIENPRLEIPKTRETTYSHIMCVGKKVVAEFVEDVFTHVAKIFPTSFIHIGGDETPSDEWDVSEHVQAFAALAGLRNTGADILEAWYCHVGKLLKKLGKTPIMWDDHFARRRYMVSRRCPDAEKDWIVQTWKLEPPVGNMRQEDVSHSFPFRTISSPTKSVYLDYPVASIDFNKTQSFLPHPRISSSIELGGCATMWTEDSLPEDVGAKVYPRFIGIAERLWGSDVPVKQDRELDLTPYSAAQQHCDTGPLVKEVGFKCGRFELRAGGRSPFWQGLQVLSTLEYFGVQFSLNQALDGDEDTYFWAISPKTGDYIEIRFITKATVLGKWLKRIMIKTGSKDRPGDQIEKAELKVVQWLPFEGGGYKLQWTKIGDFAAGAVDAAGGQLLKGPTVAIRISLSTQTKWVALPEIVVEEGEAGEHPNEAELADPLQRRSSPRIPEPPDEAAKGRRDFWKPSLSEFDVDGPSSHPQFRLPSHWEGDDARSGATTKVQTPHRSPAMALAAALPASAMKDSVSSTPSERALPSQAVDKRKSPLSHSAAELPSATDGVTSSSSPGPTMRSLQKSSSLQSEGEERVFKSTRGEDAIVGLTEKSHRSEETRFTGAATSLVMDSSFVREGSSKPLSKSLALVSRGGPGQLPRHAKGMADQLRQRIKEAKSRRQQKPAGASQEQEAPLPENRSLVVESGTQAAAAPSEGPKAKAPAPSPAISAQAPLPENRSLVVESCTQGAAAPSERPTDKAPTPSPAISPQSKFQGDLPLDSTPTATARGTTLAQAAVELTTTQVAVLTLTGGEELTRTVTATHFSQSVSQQPPLATHTATHPDELVTTATPAKNPPREAPAASNNIAIGAKDDLHPAQKERRRRSSAVKKKGRRQGARGKPETHQRRKRRRRSEEVDGESS